ncbi:hypothetical protein ES703_49286 [subsurface metagenome]
MVDVRHVWVAALCGPVLAAALEVAVLLHELESRQVESGTACETDKTQPKQL